VRVKRSCSMVLLGKCRSVLDRSWNATYCYRQTGPWREFNLLICAVTRLFNNLRCW
jgi:hypothetical protein